MGFQMIIQRDSFSNCFCNRSFCSRDHFNVDTLECLWDIQWACEQPLLLVQPLFLLPGLWNVDANSGTARHIEVNFWNRLRNRAEERDHYFRLEARGPRWATTAEKAFCSQGPLPADHSWISAVGWGAGHLGILKVVQLVCWGWMPDRVG